MCKAVEEYAKQYGIIQRNEGKIEGIIEGEIKGKIKAVKNMLKNGLDLDMALKYADLAHSDYEKYSESAE